MNYSGGVGSGQNRAGGGGGGSTRYKKADTGQKGEESAALADDMVSANYLIEKRKKPATANYFCNSHTWSMRQKPIKNSLKGI